MASVANNVTSVSTDKAIFDAAVGMLSKFAKPGQKITRDTEIMADLEIDSLAVMDFVMEMEDRFDISISLDVIPRIRTVGDLVREIETIRKG